MISNVATDPNTGRQVIVANFESYRKKLEENVDKACNEFLNEPDWDKNFEIYDALNRTAYLCPFAVAAIRRKLKTKNPEIEILALHLLEGMIKNVPSSHGAVAQPSFMRYLVKVALDTRKEGMMKSIGKKFKKDTTVNKSHLRAQTIDKALLIIQMLKNAYENSNTYPIFAETHKQLSKQGVRFPVPTKDEDSTVFAPMYSAKYENYGKNGKPPSALGSVGQIGNSVQTNHANIDRSLPMIRPVVLIADVSDQELKTAQENAKFFFEMVNASEPGSNLKENDLLQQLYTSTSEWQQRVVMKISDPNANEVTLAQGFQVNDIMNNVMEDYQALIDGKKRRYEEGLGNIDEFAKKDKKNKGNESNDDDDSNDSNDDDSNDGNNGNDAKKDDNKDSDDIFIPPPPADEGAATHHARKKSNAPKLKSKSNQKKEESGDLLDMFDNSNNNNNNNNNNSMMNENDIIRKKPNLKSEQSEMNIFDIMAIPSMPPPANDNDNDNNNNNSNNNILTNNLNDSGTMASMATSNMNNNNTGTGNEFDVLSDPFADSTNKNVSGNDANPFDMMGNVQSSNNGNNGNNNNNNNNNGSSNPFASMGDDPFAGIAAPTANSGVTNNSQTNNDFMGGADNPFALFDSSNNNSTNNNNNTKNNKSNNNNNDSSNPFDFLD